MGSSSRRTEKKPQPPHQWDYRLKGGRLFDGGLDKRNVYESRE